MDTFSLERIMKSENLTYVENRFNTLFFYFSFYILINPIIFFIFYFLNSFRAQKALTKKFSFLI